MFDAYDTGCKGRFPGIFEAEMTDRGISGARIAILGAGGQIGRGLAEALDADCRLDLFTERPGRLRTLLGVAEKGERAAEISHTSDFGRDAYDLVVNAALPGDPKVIRGLGAEILYASEAVDNMTLAYLNQQPRCKLLFLSTGAIYGNAYNRPAENSDALTIPVNQSEKTPCYPLAKIVAEAKHRALVSRSILDVRVFGYLSKELPIAGGYFLSEIANSLISGKPLQINRQNFLRDYIGPPEIADCVGYALNTPAFNRAIDLVSPEAISKRRILALVCKRLGLRCTVSDAADIDEDNPDWPRQLSNRAMEMPGFEPIRPSSEVIIDELSRCLTLHANLDAQISPAPGEITTGVQHGTCG